jgi:O-methyltransferase/methyltransferase family protein
LNTPAPHEQILAFITAFWQGRAIAVAAELELADMLISGPLTIEELAMRARTHPGMTLRLLRALESIGVFKQVAPGVFANTPLSECLSKDSPYSQWSFVLSQLTSVCGSYESWGQFGHTVKSGGDGFHRVYGRSLWDYLRDAPLSSAIFDDSMRRFSVTITPAITAAYDWGQYKTIADIGGGIGVQLLDILDRHTRSRGILFDLPHVISGVAADKRIENVCGDFFKEVPAGADAYLLRMILHDWADSESVEILKVIKGAVRPHSHVLIVEMVIPEGPGPAFAKWSDLLMATKFNQAQERTAKQFDALLATAGFNLQRIVPTASPFSVLVAKPS